MSNDLRFHNCDRCGKECKRAYIYKNAGRKELYLCYSCADKFDREVERLAENFVSEGKRISQNRGSFKGMPDVKIEII